MYTKKQQLKQNKKPKRKRCKNKDCNKLFTPDREMQPCCSFECTISYVNKPDNLKGLIKTGKKLRQKENTRKKREWKQNDKSKLKQEAQKVVNQYVRLRDKDKPCISCGHTGNRQIHCGHFRPQGNTQQLRYYTLNTFAQCSTCNNHLSGNLVPYRAALVKRFGDEWVEKLEANHETKKYTVEYLQKLIRVFRKKIKLYKKKFR